MNLTIDVMTAGHPRWEETARFAEGCSWRAGPFLARMMRENRFQPWERVIAAVADGAIAGFCTLTEKDELPDGYPFHPFIGFVFVGEAYRGRRISERMIEAALDYAARIGYGRVYLMSGEGGLYEKYGFQKLGDYETVRGTVDRLFVKACGGRGGSGFLPF